MNGYTAERHFPIQLGISQNVGSGVSSILVVLFYESGLQRETID